MKFINVSPINSPHSDVMSINVEHIVAVEEGIGSQYEEDGETHSYEISVIHLSTGEKVEVEEEHGSVMNALNRCRNDGEDGHLAVSAHMFKSFPHFYLGGG